MAGELSRWAAPLLAMPAVQRIQLTERMAMVAAVNKAERLEDLPEKWQGVLREAAAQYAQYAARKGKPGKNMTIRTHSETSR